MMMDGAKAVPRPMTRPWGERLGALTARAAGTYPFVPWPPAVCIGVPIFPLRKNIIIWRPPYEWPMGKFVLRCAGCSKEQGPERLGCAMDLGLLRADYERKRLTPAPHPGIWKFLDWLPVNGTIERFTGGPIAYQSEGLAGELGLKDLWIAFNGHWPERGADLPTCSFKDLEAPPTVRRLMEGGGRDVLVVSSAGNTGRAFAHMSCLTGYPLVLVVPSSAVPKLWLPPGDDDPSSIFVVSVEGDYTDAIQLGERIAAKRGFVPEGGARNIARRDGMGTVMLESVLAMGALPDRYFQAVGSGTGGIAAWEASMRLIGDGRFGSRLPVLHLAQNLPCAPIYSAVHGGAPDPKCPSGMYDAVLFNRRAPFDVPGGVADALAATHGSVAGITNREGEEASRMFEDREGIDIMPAAAVAVAALVKAVADGSVGKDEKVLLNITGGGEGRLKRGSALDRLEADMNVPKGEGTELIVNKANHKLRKAKRAIS